MEVSYGEVLAKHTGPESWLFPQEGLWQALTGEGTGRILSREMGFSGAPTASPSLEGHTDRTAIARCSSAPRGRRPLARVEASCAEPGRSRYWPRTVCGVRVVKRKVQP